jgi:hypothetical protein
LLAGVENLLKNAVHGAGNDEKPCVPAPDATSLTKMLGAVKRYDIRSLEDILSELERHKYESDGELVVWLREQIDNLEYDAIRKRLELYIASQNLSKI